MNILQNLPQLAARVKAAGEAAHKCNRLMAPRRLVQQEHVVLHCLPENTQCRQRVLRCVARRSQARDVVAEEPPVARDGEETRIAHGQIRLQQVRVELLHGRVAHWGGGAHDDRAVFGDDAAALRDAVEVVAVDDDEVRGCVGLEG